MPKVLAAALAVVIAATLVVVVAIGMGRGADDGGDAPGETAAGPSATSDTDGENADGIPAVDEPGDDDPGDGADTSSDPAPSPVPTVTGRSGGQTDGDASEVIPQTVPEPTSLADLLPDDIPSAGSFTSAPPDANAVDELAAGFPVDVIYVPDGASVYSSSITSSTGTSQVALDALAPGTCDELLITTRGWYTRGGFADETKSETPAGAQLAFTRDDAVVTIATTPSDGGCALVLHGVLTPTTEPQR